MAGKVSSVKVNVKDNYFINKNSENILHGCGDHLKVLQLCKVYVNLHVIKTV
jgi:hypothetical protein